MATIRDVARLAHCSTATVSLLESQVGEPRCERRRGHEHALEQFGMPVRAELVLEADSEVADAYSASLQLMITVRAPTAIFAANARLTVGVVSALNSRGLSCPGNVSALGDMTASTGRMPSIRG